MTLRTLVTAGAIAVAAPVAVAGHVGGPPLSCARAASQARAALVVEHGDTRTVTRCLSFPGDSVGGDQFLQLADQSGVRFGTQAFGCCGQAVCQVSDEVETEPAQQPPGCFGSGANWALFTAASGAPWTLSPRGISSTTVHDGDAIGFRYESGSAPPPSPSGVCAAVAATPTPSAPAPMSSSPPPAATAVAHDGGTRGGAAPAAAASRVASTGTADPSTPPPAEASSPTAATAPPAVADVPPAMPAATRPGAPRAATAGAPWIVPGIVGAVLVAILGATVARRRRA